MTELDSYCKELSAALDCPGEWRGRMLERTRRMADDFIAGNPGATDQDVRTYLGEPCDVAQTMLELENPDELTRYRRRKTLLKYALTGALILALIVFICAFVYAWKVLKHPVIMEITKKTVITYYEDGSSDVTRYDYTDGTSETRQYAPEEEYPLPEYLPLEEVGKNHD